MDKEEKKNVPEEEKTKELGKKQTPDTPAGKGAAPKTAKVIKIGSKLTVTLTNKVIAIICCAAAAVVIAGVALGFGLASGKGNNGTDNAGGSQGGGEEPTCQHQYGDWIVDTDPTCVAEGEKHRDCTLCDEQETSAIPTIDHTPVTDAAVEETCSSTGLTEGSHCSECGEVFIAQQEIAKTAHEYDDENDESCNNCDHVRDVNCTHSETKTVVGYGASCTVPGKTNGTRCVLCEEIIVPQQQIRPLGHSFADYACSVCHIDQPAGLYDENDQLVASWDELVSAYGLKIEDDYNHWDFSSDDFYKNNPSSAYNVFNNPALSDGAKLIIGDEVTQIGKYAFYRAPIKDVFISKSIEIISDGALEDCEDLKSVVFADGCLLVTIDNFVFYGTSIKEIKIPEGVQTLGSQLFAYCDKLEKVYIPSSVTEIVYTAFDSCPSLMEITVSEDNTRYCSIDGNLYNKNATTIMKYASAKADEVFVIPDSVEYIDYCAFESVNKLKTLVIGQNVDSISVLAFENCTSITDFVIEWNAHYVTIDGNLYQKDYLGWYSDDLFLQKYAPGKVDPYFTVPSGVTEIFNYAFSGNTHLVTVDIGDVEYIGHQAFGLCENLKTLKISNKLQTVDESAFCVCDNLKTVLYSGSQDEWDGIQVLNEYENNDYLLNANIICNDNPGTEGFWYENNGDGTCNLSGLWSYDYIENSDVLVIPAYYEGLTVTGISPNAFYYSNLQGKQLILPDTITSIGERAFAGADMDSVYIPDSVLEICNRAFYHSYIREVILPDTLTTIGYEAFAASEVELISIPESVTSIGALAFYNCERLHTLINRSSAEINAAFCDCTNLERIYWFTESWFDFTYNFEGSGSIKEFVIPYNSNSFSIIDGNVYNNGATFLLLYMPNNTQEIFVVPETVISIDRLNCPNLKKIVLPAGLDYISFYNCPVLEYVEVSEDNERYMSINGSLYRKDFNTLIRQAYTPGAKDIVIADGVASIEADAFEAYGNIDSVFIPKSVERFWEYAFNNTSEIKDVYYEGTEEEWQALFDNSYGNYELFYRATIHYNCEN